MAELKIRKGSFLIQVHDGGEVVFAIKLTDVDYTGLSKVVIEVDEKSSVGPHPEIEVDIRKGNNKFKKQKLKWVSSGKKYSAGAPTNS